MNTLVLQSHRDPLPFPWLAACMDSVRAWSDSNGYDYRFIGDELFETVEPRLIEKTADQKVIATDLARLYLLQEGLRQGYQRVVWCDADFLIFQPSGFVLPDYNYALGREVWVQSGENKRLKVYRKVHNAFMMFQRGNSFLDFYTETAARLLDLNTGNMPPQFIGPKLLTALHNIVLCPVLESAGMLSPLVIRDLIEGGGVALDLFKHQSCVPICAANLSSSLTTQSAISDAKMEALIDRLSEYGTI